MPHIILEIPEQFDNIITNNIITVSQDLLVAQLPAPITSFKSRVYKYNSCIVGGTNNKQLIHMTIKVMSGRTKELLITIANSLSKQLSDLLDDSIVDSNRYEITIEIVELSSSYAK